MCSPWEGEKDRMSHSVEAHNMTTMFDYRNIPTVDHNHEAESRNDEIKERIMG